MLSSIHRNDGVGEAFISYLKNGSLVLVLLTLSVKVAVAEYANPSGEMGLMIEWSWRIEGKRSILCGSWTDEQRWKKTFDRLSRTTVAAATLFGRLPEIDLTLSNRIHVVSLMTAQGDPAWTLFERRSGRVRWIHVKHGKLQIEADIQKQFS